MSKTQNINEIVVPVKSYKSRKLRINGPISRAARFDDKYFVSYRIDKAKQEIHVGEYLPNADGFVVVSYDNGFTLNLDGTMFGNRRNFNAKVKNGRVIISARAVA